MFKLKYLSLTFLLALNFAALAQILPFGIQSPSLMRPSNLYTIHLVNPMFQEEVKFFPVGRNHIMIV
jgi:hypothetical protein